MPLLCFLITGAFTSAIDGIGFKILVHLHFLNVIGPEDGVHFLEEVLGKLAVHVVALDDCIDDRLGRFPSNISSR